MDKPTVIYPYLATFLKKEQATDTQNNTDESQNNHPK